MNTKQTLNNSIVSIDIFNNLTKRLPNPSSILKDVSKTIDIYEQVAKHPDVFPELQGYRDALCSIDLSTNIDWFNEYLNEIDVSSFIRSVLSARDFGFSVLEIIEYADHKSMTVPRSISLAPINRFAFNNKRELIFIPKNNVDGIVVSEIYPNKFILTQNEPTLANPYGVALCDIAYWVAVGLNGNFEFMLNFAETDGKDKWIGTYPEGSTQDLKDTLLDALWKLKASDIAIKPEGTTMEPVENKGRTSSGQLYKDINEILIRKISKIWTGTDLTMQQSKGGYSSSQSGIEIREDALGQGIKLITHAIKTLHTFICNINQIKKEKLEVSLSSINTISKEEAEVYKTFYDTGIRFTEKFYTKRGLKPEEFELVKQGNLDKNNSSFSKEEKSVLDIFDIFHDDIQKKKT